jgi:hypothetical protein
LIFKTCFFFKTLVIGHLKEMEIRFFGTIVRNTNSLTSNELIFTIMNRNMKHLIWTVLVTFLSATMLQAQSKPPIPSSLDRQFRRDAARLALRLEAEKEDIRYLPIAISRDNINGLYKALCNIYQNEDAGKSLAKCNVHTFPNPSIDHLVIIYKKNVDWAAPLRQGITETNNKELNQLLDKYDLAIDRSMQWNDTQDAITLRSKEPLNMAALADKFRDIPGVMQTELGSTKLGGNDIKARRISGGWEIDYILSINASQQHIWKFKALDNGQVSLLKESGEPLPTWMRCDAADKNTMARH